MESSRRAVSEPVHPDLERVVAEDETAWAAVERATLAAKTQIETARLELARGRDARLRRAEEQVDAGVAAIRAEADREVARRRTRRDTFVRDATASGEALTSDGADIYARIVRDGPAGIDAP